MGTEIGNQCQLAADNSLDDNDEAVRMSMLTFFAIILEIIDILMIYAVIIVILGYSDLHCPQRCQTICQMNRELL